MLRSWRVNDEICGGQSFRESWIERRPDFVVMKNWIELECPFQVLDGFGIIRAPLYSVKAEIAEKRLEVIFRSNSLSPERMSAYCSRGKPLPAKTSNFVKFLVASLRGARRD